MGVPDHLTFPWETCMQVKKQQVEPNMGQRADWKLGKEDSKAVYCHPTYLTYMHEFEQTLGDSGRQRGMRHNLVTKQQLRLCSG